VTEAPRVDADGAAVAPRPRRIGYVGRVAGAGPAVVLIPSLGRGGEDFADLERQLNRAGFSTLSVSPVLEESDAQPSRPIEVVAAFDRTIWPLRGECQQTFEELGEVVVELARERCGEPVHLIGHAFGQALSRCIVAQHSEFVRSLTLLACGGSVASEELNTSVRACFDLDLAARDPAEHLRHVARAFFAPSSDPSAWAGGWLPEIARLQMEALFQTPIDAWRDVSFLPTRVIQALQDALAPPQDGRGYAAAHPGVELREVDGAGHAMLPERPEEIAAICLEHLRRAEGAGRSSTSR
jgi:pimeloyl-ACP methyl ester carboxylesterase